jgi:protein-disulfide isomerase
MFLGAAKRASMLIATRRQILLGASGIVAAAGALGAWRYARWHAWLADLMTPDPLGDMTLGSAEAPVTIIEYASMSCPHCARFALVTFPEIRKRYIETGKVRFIFREFPLDRLAEAVSVVTRCACKDDPQRYFVLTETLFREQAAWLIDQPLPALLAAAKQGDVSEATFHACLANQQILDGLEKGRRRAADAFEVRSTPTFFINGKPHTGALTADEMAALIDPYLTGG